MYAVSFFFHKDFEQKLNSNTLTTKYNTGNIINKIIFISKLTSDVLSHFFQKSWSSLGKDLITDWISVIKMFIGWVNNGMHI